MATNNFILKETAFLNGGRMDESGRHTITKQFQYEIVDNSPAKRRSAIIDLEKYVPAKGSCMSDDVRYILKSAEWDCMDWEKKSHIFYINANYERISDDEESNEPWDLAPFNVSTSTVEEAIAFKLAYDRNNEKTDGKNIKDVDVVNSAGDPIEANTTEIFQQFSFSYYLRDFDSDKVQEFSNSINSNPENILGHSFPSGTLLLTDINTEYLITYKDDGTVKWQYTQVNMTIRYNQNGWGRRLLDVGNRARFGNSTKSELIYQYYAPIYGGSTVEFEEEPTLTNAQGYYTANRAYRAWIAEHEDATGCPAQLPYEFAENIPLTEDGAIDYDVITNGGKYPEIEFQEYRIKTWNTLSIPTKVKKRWR